MSLGLRAKIALIVSAVLLLVSSAIALATASYFARDYAAALESRALAVGVSLKAQLERVLQFGIDIEDLIGFEEQCRAAVREHAGISYALVALADGRILFHSDPRPQARIADPGLVAALAAGQQAALRPRHAGGADYAAVVPVARRGGGTAASVVVGFPEELVGREVRAVVGFGMGAGAVAFGVGLLLLLAAVSRFVTRPLRLLIRIVEHTRSAGGDLSRRVGMRSGDELGRLAAAFDAMMDELQATTVSKTELEARERMQAAVAELSRHALAGPCDDSLFDRTAALVVRAIGVDACAVLRPGVAAGTVGVFAGAGWRAGVVGSVYRSEAAASAAAPSLASLLVEHGLHGFAAIAIGAPPAQFGTLAAYAASAEAGSEDRITFLETVANVLSAAIRRAQDEAAIQSLASTDALTGLANRRHFGELLDQELHRSRRYGYVLSVILLDIDHFKRINDRYGHLRGDAVLHAVAGIARHAVRNVETAARWGGEEFAVLAPQTGLEGARRLAERLRQAIAEFAFDEAGCVTASFGVASLEPGDDAVSLVKRADEALYRAKNEGRNRVEVAQPLLRAAGALGAGD